MVTLTYFQNQMKLVLSSTNVRRSNFIKTFLGTFKVKYEKFHNRKYIFSDPYPHIGRFRSILCWVYQISKALRQLGRQVTRTSNFEFFLSFRLPTFNGLISLKLFQSLCFLPLSCLSNLQVVTFPQKNFWATFHFIFCTYAGLLFRQTLPNISTPIV